MSDENFYHFRSRLHHMIKNDELRTILYIINSDQIKSYWDNGNPLFSLYMLATLDFLSEKNDLPLVSEYDIYRGRMLKNPFFVRDPLFRKPEAEEKADCIPAFVRYNILEGDLYDAV